MDSKNKKFVLKTAGANALREEVKRLREKVIRYQYRVGQLNWAVQELRDDKKKIREQKNKRYNKLRWKVFKLEQKIWAIRNSREKRLLLRRRKHYKFKREGIKIGKEKGIEIGIEKGIKIGIRKGRKMGALARYHAGLKKGIERQKKVSEANLKRRLEFRYKLESIARYSVIMNKLSKRLNMPLNHISFMLFAGSYEYWTKKDFDSSFNGLQFESYYSCLDYMRRKGFLQTIKKSKSATYSLTPIGLDFVKRVKLFISKYIKETKT